MMTVLDTVRQPEQWSTTLEPTASNSRIAVVSICVIWGVVSQKAGDDLGPGRTLLMINEH